MAPNASRTTSGFHLLSIESEGFEVAGRLAAHGIAAFVLAYRLEMAVRLVRSRADDFGIDSGRVGFMGFSAGGNVAMRIALADDPAASDDDLGLAGDSITLYETWHRARLSVELHMYARGGHGFGTRTQHLPSDTWIDRFLDWFDATGLNAG